MFNLPKPYPDKEASETMLQRGLERFPRRKENYHKFLNRGFPTEELDYLPIRMDYELVRRCNFRCRMCIMSMPSTAKDAEDTSFEDFKNSVNDMYGLIEIKLQGLGEPLLHPDIFDIISYASDLDIWTRTTVNGSLLHLKENYKRLIDSNPGEVQVSIDGATKDVFQHIRVGSDFDKVVSNTTLLNNYAASKGVLKTRCWSVVQKSNRHQLKEIIDLSEKMGFSRLTFSINLSSCGDEDMDRLNKEQDISTDFTSDEAQMLIEYGKRKGIEVTFWDYGSLYSMTEDRSKICRWLFERAFISSDMKVVPCCTIANPTVLNFGDGRKTSGVWNNENYRDFRRKHINGEIPTMCSKCYI
ncbi:MAG TPA: radical SAM protein [Clostridia bacterium]